MLSIIKPKENNNYNIFVKKREIKDLFDLIQIVRNNFGLILFVFVCLFVFNLEVNVLVLMQ